MTALLARPQRALEALSRLRKKLRHFFLQDGLVTLGIGSSGAIVLSFLLDYLLVLPIQVRFVFLAAAATALVFFARRFVTRPLATPVLDEELANLVERSNPELKQALVTAIELTRPGSEAALHVSPSMVRSVVERVEEGVAGIRFERIFDLRRLQRKKALLVGTLVVLMGGGIASPSLSFLWFGRNILLGAQKWPKRVLLELVSPSTNPAVVAVGDSLEVVVRAVKGSPKTVLVYTRESERALRADVLSETTSQLFRKVFENISRPFSFSIKGGDDEIETRDVEVRLRPRIDMQSMQLWLDYPPYTRLKSTPPAEPLRHGNVKVPTGTKVRYQVAANVPILKAYFVMRAAEEKSSAPSTPKSAKAGSADAASPRGAAVASAEGLPDEVWPDAGAVELKVSDGRNFAGQFTVTESGHYYFQLESEDAFRSLKPDRFRIEALPDRKPQVKILEPERLTEEVSPDASVRIRVAANDDYGIQKGSVEGALFAPGSETALPKSVNLARFSADTAGKTSTGNAGGAEDGDPGAEKDGSKGDIEDEVVLLISSLTSAQGIAPGAGSRFQYYALAADFAGNVGESQVHFLQVVDKEDLQRILSDQLMVVRDQLREILRRQRSARLDLEELQEKLGLRDKISADEGQKLFRHEQDQERITQALEREASELNHILLRTAANKLGDDQWKNWVTGVRDDVGELSRQKSPEVSKTLEELRKASAKSPQDSSRLAVAANLQKVLEREIEAIVLRLSEFGDMNALIQMLRDIRSRQEKIRDKTRSRVQGSSVEEPQK